MSRAENSISQLIRSSSNDSKFLTGSKSQSKLAERSFQLPKHPNTDTLTKNLTAISLKTRLVINKNLQLANHKRTSSETLAKTAASPYSLKDSYGLYEKFLKKLEGQQEIEKKVEVLLEFLQGFARKCGVFSDILNKVSEIVRDYQKFVKSLDTTRTEKPDFKADIKNSAFQSDNSKRIRYKVRAKKVVFGEAPVFNVSSDPRIDESEEVAKPKVSIMKMQSGMKLTNFSEVKKNINAKLSVPYLHFPKAQSADFHQEFMDKFEEFSESWREEALKIRK